MYDVLLTYKGERLHGFRTTVEPGSEKLDELMEHYGADTAHVTSVDVPVIENERPPERTGGTVQTDFDPADMTQDLRLGYGSDEF